MASCVVCGAAVAPEDSEIVENGLRCRPCGLRSQIQTHVDNVAENEEQARQRKMDRRAARVGHGHMVVWMGCAFVFALGWNHGEHRAWLWPLVVAAFALGMALHLRKRWAFWLAIAGDLAAAAPPLGWVLFGADAEERLFGAMVAAVPLGLLALLTSLRYAYR